MKILITGGGGSIGNLLANKLFSLNHEVLSVDSFINLSEVHGDFCTIDICSKTDMLSLFKKHKFDVVFHLAAVVGSNNGESNPVNCANTNILGTLNLLSLSSDFGVKKFINTSSVAVYGESDNILTENSITNPISHYGVTKLSGEMYSKLFSRNLNIVNLRLFNVYGIYKGMIYDYMTAVMDDRSLIIKGSLDRFRDFIHVDDVVDAYVKSLDVDNGTYNICTGVKTTIHSLMNKILITCKKENFDYNVSREVVIGDPFGTYGSYDKFNKAADWHPRISLRAGLEQCMSCF